MTCAAGDDAHVGGEAVLALMCSLHTRLPAADGFLLPVKVIAGKGQG